MNKCLYCGKDVKNKYCTVSCQNKHQNSEKSNKIYGLFTEFKVECFKCGIEFNVKERYKLFPQKEKYYCSRSCSNSRNWNEKDKEKISKILKNITQKDRIITKCKNCGKDIEHIKSKKRIFCSHSCNTSYYNKTTDRCRKAGLKSSQIQKETRRSKNEIYLSELCNSFFNNILINNNMFNGWDADIILTDEKIAILWNGKWHYEKIMEGHSVKQVQNRDRIKIEEIKKLGYEPYIIKDMGKYNKEFVEREFVKLKKHCAVEQLVSSRDSYSRGR